MNKYIMYGLLLVGTVGLVIIATEVIARRIGFQSQVITVDNQFCVVVTKTNAIAVDCWERK